MEEAGLLWPTSSMTVNGGFRMKFQFTPLILFIVSISSGSNGVLS